MGNHAAPDRESLGAGGRHIGGETSGRSDHFDVRAIGPRKVA